MLLVWEQVLTAAPFVAGFYLVIWNILRIRKVPLLFVMPTDPMRLAELYTKILVTASFGIAVGLGFLIIGVLTLLGS